MPRQLAHPAWARWRSYALAAAACLAALRRVAEPLVLAVRDNGRGFSQSEASAARSFGLPGMRERVRLLAGTLEIAGDAGKGTEVVVRVPVEPN